MPLRAEWLISSQNLRTCYHTWPAALCVIMFSGWVFLLSHGSLCCICIISYGKLFLGYHFIEMGSQSMVLLYKWVIYYSTPTTEMDIRFKASSVHLYPCVTQDLHLQPHLYSISAITTLGCTSCILLIFSVSTYDFTISKVQRHIYLQE